MVTHLMTVMSYSSITVVIWDFLIGGCTSEKYPGLQTVGLTL